MMIKFYFLGHDYEYEARNALRVFDLNTDFEITYSSFEGRGLSIVSCLEDGEVISAKAQLYKDNEILYESCFNANGIVLEKYGIKKLKKTLVIKTIHNVLKSYYNVYPDYGILTGVRVAKILLTAKKHSKSNEEIDDILRNTYEVKEEKIKLLWDILKIEEKYIDEYSNNKNYNLYIGIPFCPSKCSYCSFTSYVNCPQKKINSYLDTLAYEIEKTIELAKKRKLCLHTIYLGGGTPSVLSNEQIDKIFSTIKKHYELFRIKEITFEAGRPDTLDKEKLSCLKNNFVNRISINPQTMNDDTLLSVGRKHLSCDIVEKYLIAKEIGFKTINMDIILGLPGEDESDVRNTIEIIAGLNPENITVHSLAYKKHSELTRESAKFCKDYELIKKMHYVIKEVCEDKGYKPYYMYRQKNIKGNSENIGYTKKGRECIYNMVMIEELETILGCGLGATSKIITGENKHEPLRNFKSLEEYSKRIDEIINKKQTLLGDNII
ncbi:MAG TPA: coproporphyrinogen dehydrogenase HemZ [Clostridiales bacterium]|jgi:oxygen-independent coproporphyrinogen-3 oxidase|nr:coproporphyrinogen dehydrogenase HemZ [Clostridiales bacterium]HCS11897.1 coproporphyrinogen dehydrogenase HemZ [Clostridiales bacterium]